MKRRRHFVANGAVWTDLVVVSTPSLAFPPRFVEAHETMRVEALGAELAVQALDEGIVGRVAGPAEVARHVVQEGPKVELLADDLGTVVETDGLGIAGLLRGVIEGGDDIGAAVGGAGVDRRREPREGIDHGQDADLAAVE